MSHSFSTHKIIRLARERVATPEMIAKLFSDRIKPFAAMDFVGPWSSRKVSLVLPALPVGSVAVDDFEILAGPTEAGTSPPFP